MADPYVPTKIVHPTTKMGGSSPRTFHKTVAASATPEFLGDDTLVMRSLQFVGEKSAGVNNTGDITIQTQDETGAWVDDVTLSPGQSVDWPPHISQAWNGKSFKIKVATNGDGVKGRWS